MLSVRSAGTEDKEAIWAIVEPIIRAGDVYTLPPDMSREDALAYWFGPAHDVFVAEDDGAVVGTYYLRTNHRGGGAHVANCGYATAAASQGRGVARTMCEHSLKYARERGFQAMQFNFVIGTNERAVRLWHSCGFRTVGTLPGAFLHPQAGYVDAFVMYREL
jgi:ribosomal protein S18 acetylase RimI-like enzyme